MEEEDEAKHMVKKQREHNEKDAKVEEWQEAEQCDKEIARNGDGGGQPRVTTTARQTTRDGPRRRSAIRGTGSERTRPQDWRRKMRQNARSRSKGSATRRLRR